MRGLTWLSDARQDARYGLRMLRSQPGPDDDCVALARRGHRRERGGHRRDGARARPAAALPGVQPSRHAPHHARRRHGPARRLVGRRLRRVARSQPDARADRRVAVVAARHRRRSRRRAGRSGALPGLHAEPVPRAGRAAGARAAVRRDRRSVQPHRARRRHQPSPLATALRRQPGRPRPDDRRRGRAAADRRRAGGGLPIPGRQRRSLDPADRRAGSGRTAGAPGRRRAGRHGAAPARRHDRSGAGRPRRDRERAAPVRIARPFASCRCARRCMAGRSRA